MYVHMLSLEQSQFPLILKGSIVREETWHGEGWMEENTMAREVS